MAGQEKVRLLQLSVKGLENDMAALKKACREEEASIQAEHLRAERAGEPAQAMRTRLDSVQEQLQRMREEHKERIRQCEEEVLDAQREFEAVRSISAVSPPVAPCPGPFRPLLVAGSGQYGVQLFISGALLLPASLGPP